VRQIGEVQWPRQIPGDPATDFVTLRADYINDRPQALATFRRLVRATPEKHVLVFVHGYNNRFEDAVFRFAQFVHDSGAQVVPVLFSWPSKGSSFAYEYDRESASYSRDALEDGLRMLAKNPEVVEISILAHSMGNWVTLEALRQMAIRDGKVAAKIRTVVLAAPDVDVDVAREDIAAMGPQRPNFTLIVSKGEVWGGPRLGAIDPDIEPYKSELAREKIDVVNLTNVHSADVGERIMATTVGAAVGNAASLVVGIWQFLKDPTNLAVIATIASGAWAVFLFFATKFAKKSEKGSTTPSVTADHGDVAAGRDISGPINTNARDDSKG
jgi:esterase/lipase superfamily enzyme